MKKILLGAGLFIVLLALMAGVLELSSSYQPSVTIHENAPAKTRLKINIQADPEKIWAIMSDVDHWSVWNTDIQDVKLNGAFQQGTTFDWKTGGLNIHSTLHTAKPYHQIGWSGTAFGAFAIHNWTFTPKGGYTEVTVEESMEGWLVELLPKKFQSVLEKKLHSWLQQLKKEAEK
ncbi:SRPBCC family protein [Chitinophaga nivalis]|uniref:SRPBCC family protein n=1 Tax=Chitinophaga nivalis TaxID=2991709 RepID=A0ABT3IHE5_9BACT|nr:SRPBCC family protein [Chitinophaga nivalis]MCW3467120.1 SRPBCC family protein [Chitinophaga nivalis]MCW3483189.1 SRPBCC family protein [Chitinophaga nivalis]